MKADKILGYASAGVGALSALPGPWGIAAGVAAGMLALGSKIAEEEDEPAVRVERIRDHWPVVKQAIDKAASMKAAAKAKPR